MDKKIATSCCRSIRQYPRQHDDRSFEISHTPVKQGLQAFLPEADRKTLKNPRKPRLLKYPLTNAPGAPKSSSGNTSRTSKKQKGATLRYNQSRHSRPEAVPKVRNDFPALAKNGTIAPFFIKAPALETRASGHPRDSPLQRCDTRPPGNCLPLPTLLAVIRPLC